MTNSPMFRRGFAAAFLSKLVGQKKSDGQIPPARLPESAAPASAALITVPVVPANADGMLNLGQIAARLGYRLPAEFLSSMGIEPASIQMSARLYREVDFLRLLDGLDAHHAQLRGAYLTSPLSPGEHGRAA